VTAEANQSTNPNASKYKDLQETDVPIIQNMGDDDKEDVDAKDDTMTMTTTEAVNPHIL